MTFSFSFLVIGFFKTFFFFLNENYLGFHKRHYFFLYYECNGFFRILKKALCELICTRLHRMFNILQGGVFLFQYDYSQVGIFFCYLNGQHFSFQKSESNSFHKAKAQGPSTYDVITLQGGGKIADVYVIKKLLTHKREWSKNRKIVVTSFMDSPLRIVLLLQNSYDQSFFFTKF